MARAASPFRDNPTYPARQHLAVRLQLCCSRHSLMELTGSESVGGGDELETLTKCLESELDHSPRSRFWPMGKVDLLRTHDASNSQSGKALASKQILDHFFHSKCAKSVFACPLLRVPVSTRTRSKLWSFLWRLQMWAHKFLCWNWFRARHCDRCARRGADMWTSKWAIDSPQKPLIQCCSMFYSDSPVTPAPPLLGRVSKRVLRSVLVVIMSVSTAIKTTRPTQEPRWLC